jgi:hypothetical protein
MPILQMIYPDNISITIPLLIYHPTQILIGNYFTPIFQRWLKDAKYEWLEIKTFEIVFKKFFFIGIIELVKEFNRNYLF